MTPDEMVERLLDPSASEDDGRLVNDLLSEFWRGYPIENLRKLFAQQSMCDAAFLVSELGQKARPLLTEIVTLLTSDIARIRGDAIYALSQCTTWEDGWAVARVVEGLGDPHEGVRWTVGNALRYMGSSTLQAGLKYLRDQRPASHFATFENAFLTIERRPAKAESALQQLLDHDDPVVRRFGAAMCLRPRLVIDPARTALCEAAADPEIAEIARSATPMPFWADWERKG